MIYSFYFVLAGFFFFAALLLRLFDSSAGLFLKYGINVDYLRIPSRELRKQIGLTQDQNLIAKLKYQLKYKWVYKVCIYSALLFFLIGGVLELFF